MGRAPTYTKEILEFIAKERAKGTHYALIAESLDRKESTVKTWALRKDFRLMLAKERLRIRNELFEKNMTSDNPKDAQWILERLFREDFAPPKQEVKAEGQLIIQVVKHGDGSSDTA